MSELKTLKDIEEKIRKRIKEEIKIRKYLNKTMMKSMFNWRERLYLWWKGFKI